MSHDIDPTRTRLSLEALEDRRVPSVDLSILDVTTRDFISLDISYLISGGNASAFRFNAHLSEDGYLDPADLLLSGQQQICTPEDLAAGAEPHHTTFILPTRAPVSESHRFVLVVADPDGAVETPGDPSRANNVMFAVPLLDVSHTIDLDGSIVPLSAANSESGPFTGAILRGTADFSTIASVDLAAIWTPSDRYQFGNTQGEPEQWQRDEDHYAQTTVLPPLTSLVGLLEVDLTRVPALWGEAVFSINDAYDSLHSHRIPESRHYEGRALDLDILDRPSNGVEFSRLSGLSWLAGFDFVINEGTHVHVSERAAFATAIDQVSLQAAVSSGFELGRIDSASLTDRLIESLAGLDEALLAGRRNEALAQLLVFRNEVENATGGRIPDIGFAELVLVNVDILIGRTLSEVDEDPPETTGHRSHSSHGKGHFVSSSEFVATGVATHLGQFEMMGSVLFSHTMDPNVLRIHGWAIYTAANGDLLFEVISGRLSLLTGGIEATVTYIGGTGRFAQASGTGTLSAQVLPDRSIEFLVAGTIDYWQFDLGQRDTGRHPSRMTSQLSNVHN